VGRRQRALHRPAHEGGARCEQDAFQDEQDSHADEEVDERYGPHRTSASRKCFLLCQEGRSGTASPLADVSYCFGAAAAGLPEALPKKRKKSESGRSRKRVSLARSPCS